MLSIRHLTTMDDLTLDDLNALLETAASFAEVNERPIKKLPTLRGRTIINLFMEPSTRTRSSFEIAAKRLSADAINLSGSSSSTVKGESLMDTAQTLSSMAADAIIVRHRYAGAPQILIDNTQGHVINAGDGMHQHPTQTLLDLYTLRNRLGDVAGKTVALIGDILHSRVAGSLAPTLKRLGARVIFVGPATMMPARPDLLGAETATSLDEVIKELDVLYLLRIQKERCDGIGVPTLREYAALYGFDLRRASLLPARAVVMHPGPLNRGVEISADGLDDPRIAVLDQVSAGVAVRMALLYLLLGGASDGATA